MVCVQPIDTSSCPDWDAYDDAVQERSVFMAWETLRYLTGFRVGNCPVTLRPCMKSCWDQRTWETYPSGARGGLSPHVIGGQWYNIGCGCRTDNCACVAVCEIRLPGEVAVVDQVLVDGVVLDPDAYRVDNGYRLVRLDDACWPLCQHMEKALTEVGTFGVTYTPGVSAEANPWVQSAAGALACEYAKSSSGSSACRLPANVTRVVRQGVTMDLATNPFPGGLTGLREVDTLIARYNPYRLTAPSLVYSPDRPVGRTTTWSPS